MINAIVDNLMINKNIQNILFLQRILNTLLINGVFLYNMGLYNGKMGLVLFFFHYARYTQNEFFKEYSFDFTEKKQYKIHKETPVDYRQGLTGIGSAIEYLVQKGDIKTDTDEILEDFDDRIFSILNIPQLSIEIIMSIRYNANWRILGNSHKKDIIRQTILSRIEHHLHDHSATTTWYQFNVKNHQYGMRIKTYSHFLELITNNEKISLKSVSDFLSDNQLKRIMGGYDYNCSCTTSGVTCLLKEKCGADDPVYGCA